MCLEIFLNSVGRWRLKIRKITVEILLNVNNRTQTLRQILHMVITEIVINCALGRLTLSAMQCYILPICIVPDVGTMFMVSSFFLSVTLRCRRAMRSRGA